MEHFFLLAKVPFFPSHKDVLHETNEGWSSETDGKSGDRSRVESKTSEVVESFCTCDNMCVFSVCE